MGSEGSPNLTHGLSCLTACPWQGLPLRRLKRCRWVLLDRVSSAQLHCIQIHHPDALTRARTTVGRKLESPRRRH